MKILHTGDLHLRDIGLYANQPNEIFGILNKIVEIACSNNVDVVVLAGDISDRYNCSNVIKIKFIEFLNELFDNGKLVIAIPGSHDSFEGDSWLNVIYRAVNNPKEFIYTQEIVKKEIHIKHELYNFTFVPWNFLEKDLEKILDSNESEDIRCERSFLIGHFMAPARNVPDVWSTDISLRNWNRIVKYYDAVFLGHYHHARKLEDNAWYCGSVYSTRNTEEESTMRCIGIWEDVGDKGLYAKVKIQNVSEYVLWSKIKRNIKYRSNLGIDKIVVVDDGSDFREVEKLLCNKAKAVILRNKKTKKIDYDVTFELEATFDLERVLEKIIKRKGFKNNYLKFGMRLLNDTKEIEM